MQLKTLLTIFAAAAIASAAALPEPEPVAEPAAAALRKWTAEGGCKIDWSRRCNAQCKGEAINKGYKCKDVDSDIIGGPTNCVPGWSICRCTCFY